jgi:hypothetical protein
MTNSSKTFVIKHKARKFLYKYKSSEPYLSVSLYQRFADYCINEISQVDRLKLGSAKVLFVKGHLVEQLFQENYKQIIAKVIITAGSDNSFDHIPDRLPPKVKHIFAQNSLIKTGTLVSAIPIGIEPPEQGWNGVPSLMVNKTQPQGRIDRILVGPYGETNLQRVSLVDSLKKQNGPWDIYERKMYPDLFVELHRKYNMTLCPAGNGLDTYRIWETLYRGGLPIVDRNDWTVNMVRSGFPLQIVDFEDLQNLIAFTKKVKRFDHSNEPILYSNYWKDKINSYI